MTESFPFFHFGVESIVLNDMINEFIRTAYKKKYTFEMFMEEFEKLRIEYPETNVEDVEERIMVFCKENKINFP
jgi:hypothetical protein